MYHGLDNLDDCVHLAGFGALAVHCVRTVAWYHPLVDSRGSAVDQDSSLQEMNLGVRRLQADQKTIRLTDRSIYR